MHVLKFGGSSIAHPDRIATVLNLLKSRSEKGERLCIIFSAYQGVTDQLIELGTLAEQGDDGYKKRLSELEKRHIETADTLVSLKNRSSLLTEVKILLNELEEILYGIYLIRELTVKTLDYIQSFGERLSAYTIYAVLTDRNVASEFIDTRKLIKTDNHFGNARVNFQKTEQNIQHFIDERVPVYIATGFIGSTDKDETTTLGRGGSDYSASIFGAALKAGEIEIWTDVDGVLTADPRKVKGTFSIGQMTYEEAMELSHFGAKVIHPPTMQPALDKKLPIRILNTFNPGFSGTVISAEHVSNDYIIRGISSIDTVALLQIRGSGMIGSKGIAERIFGALARHEINIILISQASSEHSICLAISPEHAQYAKEALHEELKYELHYELVNEIEVEPDMAIIAVVGENMRHRKGIAGRVFQTLGKNGVNISAIAQGSSELNISMVVSKSDETKALNVLHKAFFDKDAERVHIFMIGAGLVGGELLNQIRKMEFETGKAMKNKISVTGVCNTSKMLIDEKGIPTGDWKTCLSEKGRASDLEAYLSDMIKLGLPESIVVDCTSSQPVTDYYPRLLEQGISIVTPNKVANTRSINFYKTLRTLTGGTWPSYRYETTVGAGLPVIKTLRELLEVNDKIHKIEGVLSGTMSFLFNSYDGRTSFSNIVQKAQDMGYTEPDPRNDLSGLDVVRKLLILIREIGLEIELQDIAKTELLPKAVINAPTIAAFYQELANHEDYFLEKLKRAVSEHKVLRYIARYAGGQATVGLEAVGEDHSFYSLRGGENIISITSELYKEYPLIIRGSGAGAAVTAAGVLADILQTKGAQS